MRSDTRLKLFYMSNIVGREILTPYFMKIPLYCLPPPFSNFVQPPPLLPPTPTPSTHSVVFFLWLNG